MHEIFLDTSGVSHSGAGTNRFSLRETRDGATYNDLDRGKNNGRLGVNPHRLMFTSVVYLWSLNSIILREIKSSDMEWYGLYTSI